MINIRSVTNFILTLFFLNQLSINSAFAEPTIYTGLFSKTALKGYDVVSYFETQTAQKGKKEFSFKYQDVNWLFSSQKNLETFKTNPAKFMPEYGGWCAYAMADGQKVGVDPKSFDFKNGKLYLNYNKKIQSKWRKKQDVYIPKADKFWQKI